MMKALDPCNYSVWDLNRTTLTDDNLPVGIQMYGWDSAETRMIRRNPNVRLSAVHPSALITHLAAVPR